MYKFQKKTDKTNDGRKYKTQNSMLSPKINLKKQYCYHIGTYDVDKIPPYVGPIL